MFRCITELRGLIIDIDTFDEPIEAWDFFLERYHCCFLTFKEDTRDFLKEVRGGAEIIYKPDYTHVFAPSPVIHEEALKALNLLTSQVAYISKNIRFIENALCFISGTIWIKQECFTYQNAGIYPDLVYDSLSELSTGLQKGTVGNYGEVRISPDASIKRGYCVPVIFEVDGERVPIFALGRYFGYSHYMNQLHPYSTAIFWNKKQSSKAYGVFNEQFAVLLSRLVGHVKNTVGVDCVCHVPVRPGKDNRFKEMIDIIANNNQVENISEYFVCIKDYETQKSLTEVERQENIRDVFNFNGDLQGKNVILIDDIMTTGATVAECVRSLKRVGAEDVVVIVLAINQIGRGYWSFNQPGVMCPACGKKMHLMVNSNNKSFFYSCYDCRNTMGYEAGRKQLIEKVDQEFVNRKQINDDAHQL